MKVVLAATAMLIGAAAASIVAGSARWNRVTAERVAGLGPPPLSGAVYREDMTAGLPGPAVRYFRRALRDGQPFVRSVVASQEAEFFINGAWRPLRAVQHFVTTRPGFVWDAKIGMAPLIPASVRDAYVDGRGMMQASIYGLYSLADQVDTPELNAGALQRYLGEAIWFPTALLPSERITWAARDDRSATATLRDSGLEVSLVFEIDAAGHPIVITGERFKEGGGRYTLQPWQIRCNEFRDRDGMVVPMHCEVAWVANGAAEPYWRGRISSIEYQYN